VTDLQVKKNIDFTGSNSAMLGINTVDVNAYQ
jgi:hypothetical protein